MEKHLQVKLAKLPTSPGVYFHKNAKGEIIYVGKAAVLKNRVRQYFQKSRSRDPKTEALVAEIADTDWTEVETELDALFLEAEMVRRYLPRYNILLRDDKSLNYIRVDYDSEYPTVTTTRRPLDDGAKYFGPYISGQSVRIALKYLRRAFPYATRKTPGQNRATLYYHLGLDPGLESGKTSLEDYRANLRKLMSYIQGNRTKIIRDIEREMKTAAKAKDFEHAARSRNQLFALKNLSQQIIFSDKEFLDISKDHALNELIELLRLPEVPRRIEGYDVSHMSGTDVVASMVVFTHGVSDKASYRKFKTKINQNNDFYNMHETIARRLSFQGQSLETGIKLHSKQNNKKSGWKLNLPDLVLIDGGKGQLDAAIKARDTAGHQAIPFVGLAKREEQIVIAKDNKVTSHNSPVTGGSNVDINLDVVQKLGGFVTECENFILVNLPHSTNVIKLLQRIRDESHRFAVSYHSTLKNNRQSKSLLDDIPTVGPETRKKLIKVFGSARGVAQARDWELQKVVGNKKAKIIHQYLRAENKSSIE